MTLAERLRVGAESLEAAGEQKAGVDDFPVEGVLLATVPSGVDAEVRVIWKPATASRRPVLSIRLWVEVGPGRWRPRRDIGIEILAWRLPELARGVAQALELAESYITTSRTKPR